MPRAVRYRVLRKIANGGMAEIFLALQTGAEGFQKTVVLKRILPAFAADPHFVRMLVDEAHIASSLNHSHLVQVLDLGQAGGQFFLVLEFVDGWSLEDVRRRAQKLRTKFPLPLALHIVASLCRALAYVHRRTRDGKALGIVHRDVSPQNVLLGREGEVKLADFGIAKAVGRREKSATGIIKGKFAYMSPEQSMGSALDARSDLFSVGTLLYILTTGRKPFDAPTDLEVLMQVRRARYEKPSELVRDFNPEVERFIARALRADRSRRWQSAEQMADRLDAILVKLGQASGPAALKRWLDGLSARDGVKPPGDLGAEVNDAGAGAIVGTIELETGDLDLPGSSSSSVEISSSLPDTDATDIVDGGDADVDVVVAEPSRGSGVDYASLSIRQPDGAVAPSPSPAPAAASSWGIPVITASGVHDAPTRPIPAGLSLGEPEFVDPDDVEEDADQLSIEVPIYEEEPISRVPVDSTVNAAIRTAEEVAFGHRPDFVVAPAPEEFTHGPPPGVVFPDARGARRRPRWGRRLLGTAALTAMIAGGAFLARPYVAPLLPVPVVARVDRILNPVDAWLKALPARLDRAIKPAASR